MGLGNGELRTKWVTIDYRVVRVVKGRVKGRSLGIKGRSLVVSDWWSNRLYNNKNNNNNYYHLSEYIYIYIYSYNISIYEVI